MSRITYILLVLFCSSLAAEELPYTLNDLMSHAERYNPEIQALCYEYRALCTQAKELQAAFHPEIAAEGGVVVDELKDYDDRYGYLYVEARWNLFRGGYDSAASYIHDCRVRQNYLEYEKKRKALRRDVWRLFISILYFQNSAGFYEEFLQLNEKYREMAEKKWRSGLTTEADILEFDLMAADIETELQSREREWHQLLHEMALLVSSPCDACSLKMLGGGLDFAELEDCYALYDEAILHREDYLQLELEELISCQSLKQAQSRTRPQVDLRASLGTEPDYKEERDFGGRFALNVRMPLFDGGSGRYSQKSVRQENQAIKLRRERLEQKIYAEIVTILCKLEILHKRLSTAYERQNKLESYRDLTIEEYVRGVKDSPELASAADRLLRARLDVLDIKKDIQLTLADLSAALGSDPGRG